MLLFYHAMTKTQVCTFGCISTLLVTKEQKRMKMDNCPVEATLDLIGGKYKALILWHLSNGKLRFSELKKVVKNATPKMLTQQLRELESQALIHREVFPVVPPKVEYSLTDLGRSLLPILVAMRDWGSSYLRERDLEPNCFMMHSTPATK